MIATFLSFAVLATGPTIEPLPDDPGISIGDERTRRPDSREPGPNPIATPEPVYKPDPFFCRPQAPFPQETCIPYPEDEEPPRAQPVVTPGQIEREVRRLRLPSLRLTVQPPNATLVNLPTIFHTTPRRFDRTVTVLGSTVNLRAEAISYTWHHGDQTQQVTTDPGSAYPNETVTHRYLKRGEVTPSVDVTYQITYQINDRNWQTLQTTITAAGPAAPLRVREARPVLTQ